MSDHGFSIAPFKTLVELVGRAFYDGVTTRDNRPKSGRSDNAGIVVVILDALTRCEWVREEDLAKNLKLHSKQLRRILRFLEEEKLVNREQRKETTKHAKIFSAAVDVVSDKSIEKNGDEKIKLQTHSYCCLDYAQIIDVVRFRLNHLRKKMKDELESKNTVQEYVCPRCSKRYTALDALQLVSFEDDYFHCERCNSELVVETDKLSPQEMGDGDDSARRRRREKLKLLLQMMEAQLKPLMHQLNIVKDLKVPEFGTLQEWEIRVHASSRAVNSGCSTNDPSTSVHGIGCHKTLMPFVGETKIEVSFAGIEEKGEDMKSEKTPLKELPPWMIKQGMNLAQEQCGIKAESMNRDATSTPLDSKDDKLVGQQDDITKNIQDEYLKAYYNELRKQRDLEAIKSEKDSCPTNPISVDASTREAGMKSKRDDYEDGEEWQHFPSAGEQVAKANSEDEDEDDIDWEEG